MFYMSKLLLGFFFNKQMDFDLALRSLLPATTIVFHFLQSKDLVMIYLESTPSNSATLIKFHTLFII